MKIIISESEYKEKFATIAGLVMAGGQSKRMGRDKALLAFGTSTLLDLACGKIGSLTNYWHVSCAKGRPRSGYPCLEDDLENCGPLAGILKALQNAAEHDYTGLLVLACDVPLMRIDLLAALIAAHLSAPRPPFLTLYQNPRSGILEMQTAIYAISALPYFQEAAKEGSKRLSAIIPPEKQLRLEIPPEFENCFINCNSPDDLRRAQAILSGIQ